MEKVVQQCEEIELEMQNQTLSVRESVHNPGKRISIKSDTLVLTNEDYSTIQTKRTNQKRKSDTWVGPPTKLIKPDHEQLF